MQIEEMIERFNAEGGTATFRRLVERNPEKMRQLFVSLLDQKKQLEELIDLQLKQISGGNKIIEILKKEIVDLKKANKKN